MTTPDPEKQPTWGELAKPLDESSLPPQGSTPLWDEALKHSAQPSEEPEPSQPAGLPVDPQQGSSHVVATPPAGAEIPPNAGSSMNMPPQEPIRPQQGYLASPADPQYQMLYGTGTVEFGASIAKAVKLLGRNLWPMVTIMVLLGVAIAVDGIVASGRLNRVAAAKYADIPVEARDIIFLLVCDVALTAITAWLAAKLIRGSLRTVAGEKFSVSDMLSNATTSPKTVFTLWLLFGVPLVLQQLIENLSNTGILSALISIFMLVATPVLTAAMLYTVDETALIDTALPAGLHIAKEHLTSFILLTVMLLPMALFSIFTLVLGVVAVPFWFILAALVYRQATGGVYESLLRTAPPA
ncbi:hypothetical protein ACFPVT_01970 [Corynebacterium choanae]|uniref:Uncharacterized protein n=1 Tax=Corynebacterium choanae TaxID=1862358 RepID=A0A3G6J3J1_9CORY|nr:hypothetical protein [Corynebacterium choanae]AZA12641.1 hypothetical protein CCHOA_01065 [Corynebacterium choanae]